MIIQAYRKALTFNNYSPKARWLSGNIRRDEDRAWGE
jgi:hypothetical protein